tara:strand:+ start:1009 stop:1320 length:312 start_codon:yes stop_codon:yes gene_type:complete
MPRTTNYRILNPILATTREIAEVLNNTVNGKLNSVGNFTIPTGGADVTVTDARAGKESVIILTPLDTHYYTHNPYIKTKNNGSFVVAHTSHTTASEVDYVIIG